MKWFKKKLKAVDINLEEIMEKIEQKHFWRRYFMFLFGLFLSALSFNLFFAPYNIVTGGTTGLSLLAREWFSINTADFVFVASLILLIISLIFLGFEMTFKTIIGILILPFFMKMTQNITSYIDLKDTSMFVISLFGGIVSGVSSGLTYKAGFSSGGMQVMYQVMNKYFKISLGKASLFLNIVIIIIGSFVFGVPMALYAVIALYISSVITDKVLLGISDSKAFYIITNKEEEISKFIIDELKHSVTLVDARGGYTNDKLKMLMCVIPTREYFKVKEVILELDHNAFFLIVDAYEFQGGF